MSMFLCSPNPAVPDGGQEKVLKNGYLCDSYVSVTLCLPDGATPVD